ncbi:ribose-phosphate pyrophosphokinase [Ralstonia solanacearum]|uniref:ribose-phosphate pyrophosphokinase n=1 Tax=Ralstonia solanacearum TaxID=305 RepID=UPI0005AC5C4B|nr:ribose-phosphate pyrophosphokinase [Ralstonia solanacearum]MDC6177067.1 ribose-phosphate pyrophosphokinase [Ralstonia solanacearum]MDC6238401.1 ribose-phosphate pyrophosphokinase [Ralstonia solanacearum]
MTPLVLVMPGNEAMAGRLAAELDAEAGAAIVRRFPDGESYVCVQSAVQDRQVAIVCTLDRPDDKLVPLLLLAAAVRDGGAASVGLIAPYLAYMRQDKRFHPGETVSAQHFAAWLSSGFDWLVTVDPHLHRIVDLSQAYPIATRNVHAAPAVATWIRTHVVRPLLVGPDEESEQWVADVARRAKALSVVLRKVRKGDRDVEVTVPDVERWRTHTPVLVDDIISTGRTMIETIGHLRRAGLQKPVCIAVHAVFSGNAAQDLTEAGAGSIVSCDTIAHPSNAISVAPSLACAVRELLPAQRSTP